MSSHHYVFHAGAGFSRASDGPILSEVDGTYVGYFYKDFVNGSDLAVYLTGIVIPSDADVSSAVTIKPVFRQNSSGSGNVTLNVSYKNFTTPTDRDAALTSIGAANVATPGTLGQELKGSFTIAGGTLTAGQELLLKVERSGSTDAFAGDIGMLYTEVIIPKLSDSLDAAYSQGQDITFDSGPINMNGDGLTDGGFISITSNVPAEVEPAIKVAFGAIAAAGVHDGLNVDYSSLSSLNSGDDAHGVYLQGYANAGAGSSYGVKIDENFDKILAIGSSDEVSVVATDFGTSTATLNLTTLDGSSDEVSPGVGFTTGSGGVDSASGGGNSGSFSFITGLGGDADSNSAGNSGGFSYLGLPGGTGTAGIASGDGGNVSFTVATAGVDLGGGSGDDGYFSVSVAGEAPGTTAGYINMAAEGFDLDTTSVIDIDAGGNIDIATSSGSSTLTGESSLLLKSSSDGTSITMLAGGAADRGSVRIGTSEDEDLNQLVIFDGSGTDLAGELVLYNESNDPYVLWIDSSGNLRKEQASTKTNDTAGSIV
jgi:hypothetical protein